MTAIVGHRDGWIVADVARGTGSWRWPFTSSKIMRFGPDNKAHTLVASSGAAGAFQIFRELQQHHSKSDNVGAQHVIDSLCEMSMEDRCQPEDDKRWYLVVTSDRRIVIVDSIGIAHDLDTAKEYFSIGAGDELCLGFLAGLEHKTVDICAHDAVQAIRFASSLNMGVSYATTMEHL